MPILFPTPAAARIWRTPTTNVGSSSWIGESGEEAILAPSTVGYLWDANGGITSGTHNFDQFGLGRPNYVDLDNEGVLTLTTRLTMWWTGPSKYALPGVPADLTQFMQLYFYGDAFSSNPGLWGGTGYYDSDATLTQFIPEENEIVFSDNMWGTGDIDPNLDWDDSDAVPGWTPVTPAAAGLSGWKTGWLRFTANQLTDAITIEMSTDANGTPASWTTVGSAIWTSGAMSGGPFSSYVGLAKWWNGGGFEPNKQSGYTIHDWEVKVDGVFQYGFTASEMALKPMPIGNASYPSANNVINATTWLDSGTGDVIYSSVPGVYLPHTGSQSSNGTSGLNAGSGVAPLWTSGPTLISPCILYSRASSNPGHIVRITGVQPTDFYGLTQTGVPVTSANNVDGVFPGGWCWGVCDLADPLVGPNFWLNGAFVQDLP